MKNLSPKPLRRHPALQPLSRANHQGLMFCLLLDKGLRKEVEPQRLQDFISHFYQTYWQMHRERLRTAMEHLPNPSRSMAILFQKKYDELTTQWERKPSTPSLSDIQFLQETLRSFIRWQERELFMEIQEAYPEAIENLSFPEPAADICSHWPDPFWES